MTMHRAYADDGKCFLLGEAGLAFFGPDILKPPHLVTLPPQPEPGPLTEDELALMGRDADRVIADTDAHPLVVRGMVAYVPLLVAEVRRLRDELAACEERLDDRDYKY